MAGAYRLNICICFVCVVILIVRYVHYLVKVALLWQV